MWITYTKLLMTAIFWGGTFIAGRMVAADVGPYSAAFLRFAVASGFLLPVMLRVEGRIPKLQRHQALPVLLLGLTGVFAYNVCFFKGLKLIEAGRAAVIIACNPILIAVFSALLFRERLTALKLGGIAISVSGAAVVITRGQLGRIVSGGFGWGEVYIFGSVASWVAFSLIGKKALVDMSPLTSVFYASLAGTAALLYPALHEGLWQNAGTYALHDWMGIGYLGFFGTVLGFVWYYQGIQRIGPTRASLFINFVPASGVLLAFWVLNEPITASLIIGTLLVSTGVYLTNRPETKGRTVPGQSSR
jgi:drug/metabolite transporter (DMT)-like permease